MHFVPTRNNAAMLNRWYGRWTKQCGNPKWWAKPPAHPTMTMSRYRRANIPGPYDALRHEAHHSRYSIDAPPIVGTSYTDVITA